MTTQEQQMIDGLISRIRSTKVENKDMQAEQYLQQGLAGYPDAVYVLAQTVLVQQYGLQQAQAQMEALKQQNSQLQDHLQQTEQTKGSGGGFLSHIFGGGSSSPTASQGQVQSPQYQPVNNPGPSIQAYPGGGYPPPPPAYPPQAYPTSGGGMFGGGGGGFLSGALQTAAGVAAGEAMFQGMESLFHGFEHHNGGYGSGFTGGGGETVNNYYDDDRGQGNDRGRDDNSFYNPSDDASRSDTAQFTDTGTGNNDVQDLGSGMDDSSNFDDGGSNAFDDNSSMDDSSGGF